MNNLAVPKFWVYAKRKRSSDHSATLYIKIVFNDQSHERSTGIKCPFESWQKENMVIENSPAETVNLKKVMDEIKQKVMGAYYLFKQEDSDFSLTEILEVASGNRKPAALSFFQSFEDIITRMKKAIGEEGYSQANIQKHTRCLAHLKMFAKIHYSSGDLNYSKIDKEMVEEMFRFFKVEGKCQHNTAMKYLQIVKKVYKVRCDNGWVKNNAFTNFKFRFRITDRTYLSEQEVVAIQQKDFRVERLNKVKNLFIFSCFTGLAYIDVKNLTKGNIIESSNGLWIKSKRSKTKVEASIPLLPPAKEILDLVHPGWLSKEKGVLLFDTMSNQKINAYLKEIAHICGIDKELTFHLARHTFATTITLSNGIPIETVSKMLGHTRISMTQHYSKVIDMKIAKDTEKLYLKFQ